MSMSTLALLNFLLSTFQQQKEDNATEQESTQTKELVKIKNSVKNSVVMDRCKTIEDVIKRIEYDGIEYVRFEASNCNGQSFGKTVPARHIRSTFKTGLPIFCGTWFFTALYGVIHDTEEEGLTYRNVFNFPYPDTYTIVPYSKNSKVARIMMYPLLNKITKQVWPLDPRSICLLQLRELKAMGYSLYSSFEHEFQIIDNSTAKPLWSGTEYCSHNKFNLNQDFAFEIDKYLCQMGVDIETMHVEYSPGQLELPMKPEWGIYAADNSFTFRNSIKQIAAAKNYLATFATTPFPADMTGASNGAHFNFSLWSDEETKQEEKVNVNAFYDETSENKLSDVAMYFIGGILEHIDAMTIFSNSTPNCFRRSNAHCWSPGNVSYGRNNRTVLLRFKTDGASGTYMEYRLPASACNPYMAMTSVIAAGIDGIKNKIKPKVAECTKDAWDDEYKDLPLLLNNMEAAIEALGKDKVIWDAFGDRFCSMLINTKKLELEELEDLAKKMGREAAETKMFLNI